MEDKIIDLEIRLTHQEDHIQELDNIIYQQQKMIDQLREQMDSLIKRLKNLSEQNVLSPSEEGPPPHY